MHRSVVSSLDQIAKKRKAQDEFDNYIYKKEIGCLLYIAGSIHPNILFAVCKLSQYCENPTVKDWENVKHVLKYLKGTIDY